MSTSMSVRSPAIGRRSRHGATAAYFGSDAVRVGQTVLGLIWLLDGALQFQSFMYSRGFIQMITAGEAGQPGWLHDSIAWGAKIAGSNLTLWNTLFALTQVAIGVGLLYRPTVKPALMLSFGWALFVWWFGEAFGMLFMNMAQPLTGAPGGVIMYALIGLLLWPNGKPAGLLSVRGARTLWAGLWLVSAWLWLTSPGSGANAITGMVNAAPSGMSWLSSFQDSVANAARGDGLVIAVILAVASAVIGLAVLRNWRAREFLALGIGVQLLFWILGQGFGGMFAGGATDPNAAPLFILLAYLIWKLVPYEVRTMEQARAS